MNNHRGDDTKRKDRQDLCCKLLQGASCCLRSPAQNGLGDRSHDGGIQEDGKRYLKQARHGATLFWSLSGLSRSVAAERLFVALSG